jgi:hypothetical protein
MVSLSLCRAALLSGGSFFLFLRQTRRDGLGKLIRPGITAVIVKRGFAKAHLRLFVNQVPAAKTAFWQFVHEGKGHAESSTPKFLQIDHEPVSFRFRAPQWWVT